MEESARRAGARGDGHATPSGCGGVKDSRAGPRPAGQLRAPSHRSQVSWAAPWPREGAGLTGAHTAAELGPGTAPPVSASPASCPSPLRDPHWLWTPLGPAHSSELRPHAGGRGLVAPWFPVKWLSRGYSRGQVYEAHGFPPGWAASGPLSPCPRLLWSVLALGGIGTLVARDPVTQMKSWRPSWLKAAQ